MNSSTAQHFVLFGKTTKEIIRLGEGHFAWQLSDFPGPLVSAADIGGPSRRHLWLPRPLLDCLYTRFALANPDSTKILTFEEADLLLQDSCASEDEMQARYDRGEILIDLMERRGQPSLERLRAYLPEVFETEECDRLLREPLLDPRHATDPGVDFQTLWDERRHFRWSASWGQICNRKTGS
jgi:hypothetical protein